MEKKITLKDFFESKEELCIHCDTEEKANMLLEAFDKIGKKWITDTSYLEHNNWKNAKQNTVYYNVGTYDDIENAKKDANTIYEFEEVDLESTDSLQNKMRTEQEVLKDFEKLGYDVHIKSCTIRFKSLDDEEEAFYIDKTNRTYETNTSHYISMNEHKLLCELFEIWGWLN